MTQKELTDRQRVEFLLALDNAPFEVTQWEAKFLESFKRRPDTLTAWFSPRQREKIDQMIHEYGHRLPIKSTPAPAPALLPPFEPGKCAWLYREDGRSRRCGEPARHKTAQGLELCQTHHDERARYLERMREMKTRRRS